MLRKHPERRHLMPDSGSTFDLAIEVLQSIVWFVSFLGSYVILAAAIFAGGWFIWRFVNDVLFP
jgi:hypothetical protein